MTAEHQRLAVNATRDIPLVQWGPYLSERQWGTVREDYSPNGDAWHYFPFDHSHSRVYKWGEDGLAGMSDYFQNLCFSVALWNGKDPILKERLFGLGNSQGNHGEDVKELYYYLDNIPTHSYMEYLYKYPQQEFPYEKLREENRKRSRQEPEYEILDTGVFDKNQYFDVHVTYAKQGVQDIFIKIDITNRYSKAAEITVLPTLWFYNRWNYGGVDTKPSLTYINKTTVKAEHERLDDYFFYFMPPTDRFFTENETNTQKITGVANESIFVKDAFHDAVINGENITALRNKKSGTKFAAVYKLKVQAGETKTLYCRLSNKNMDNGFGNGFEKIFATRKEEANDYYAAILPKGMSEDMAKIQRQALAGLLWSKQYYHFDVERWLSTGDGITEVSVGKMNGRNNDWKHLKNQDIISMPDKWEYPWYAAWDLAFQCISMAVADPTFAKHQLLLVMREWYMKPDGQLPAYEWNFSDVNPPVQAWAAMQVYNIEKKQKGVGDIIFLKKVFQKLLINFTWWINRKDVNGNNIFEGGFLGLDNIGVFNRSFHFAGEMQLEQADGTSWMGTYALDMMDIAIEIAMHDESFEDTAEKGMQKEYPPLVQPDISRDFVYIDDTVYATLLAANADFDVIGGQSINIASNIKTTIRDIANTTKEIFNIPAEPVWGDFANRKWDLKEWYGNAALAKKLLNWEATTSLKDGLIKTYKWQAAYSKPLYEKKIYQDQIQHKITAIIACYKDAQAMPFMYERLVKTFHKINADYEIIFVNDCSPDNTSEVLQVLVQQDSKVIGIEHSRNFGSQSAFMSGMEIATGDVMVLLDGDLQDPPELIENFYEKWKDGNDVVYGQRIKRDGNQLLVRIYKVFYRIFRNLSYVPIPLDAGDFSMMDKKVVSELVKLPETDQFLRGLRAWVGFKQIGVPYTRPERMFGVTTNNWRKNLAWARKAIFSFSYVPLELLTYLGWTLTLVSFLAIVLQIILYFTGSPIPHGITTIIVLILFFGGINMLAISVIGEYQAKILEEVKKRPKFIRRRIIKTTEDA